MRHTDPHGRQALRLIFPSQPGLGSARARIAALIANWPFDASWLFYLAAGLFVAAIVLGGGTRQGYLSDAILQLLAIPALLLSVSKLLALRLKGTALAALGFCSVLASLPILQLIPLPPWLWTLLPGRSTIETTYAVIGGDLPWRPLSVTPEATWVSGLALLPPLAIFASMLLLTNRERRLFSIVVLTIGVLSVVVGLVQVAQGPQSSLRFFEFTNTLDAVGFFANRNHFAALTYCLIVLAAVWTAHATFVAEESNRAGLHVGSITAALAGLSLIVFLLAGEAMSRSRAGLGLTILALIGSVAAALSDQRARFGLDRTKRNYVFIGIIVLAVMLVIQFAFHRVIGRFGDTFGSRIDFLWHTLEAAIAHLPFGSGLGSFVPVYAMFERPEDTVANTYTNHAHNEIVEVSLETGLLGIGLMAVFAIWFATRSVEIWRGTLASARDIDRSLARAATIIVALVSVHSLVDYPVRTSAMTVMIAFACGLMFEPVIQQKKEESPLSTRKRLRQKPRPARPNNPRPTSSPVPASLPSTTVQHKRWDADIVWPQEWSSQQTEDGNETGHQNPQIRKIIDSADSDD